MAVRCTARPCLQDELLISRIEESSVPWSPARYPQFKELTLAEARRRLLGVSYMGDSAVTSPVQMSYSPTSLPLEYDLTTSTLLTPLGDLPWCSLSWATTPVAVASDRLSLALGRPVRLSPDGLLECREVKERISLSSVSN